MFGLLGMVLLRICLVFGLLDYSELAFTEWLTNFVAVVTAHAEEFAIEPSVLASLTNSRLDWNAAHSQAVTTRTAYGAAVQTKDSALAAVTPQVRSMVRQLQANPNVTDAMKRELGITIPSPSIMPAPITPTRPMATVDISQRLQHTLKIWDDSNPSRRSKPKGVFGCQVWVKTGEGVPSGQKDCVLLDTAPKTLYTVEYDPENAGKTAHYMLRWVDKNGLAGPWSETISATIAA